MERGHLGRFAVVVEEFRSMEVQEEVLECDMYLSSNY